MPFMLFCQLPSELEEDSYKMKDKDMEIVEKYPTWLIIEYAKRFRKEGNINTSLLYLMKAQSKSYNSPDVLFELGVLYKDIQDFDVSLDYFTRTLDILKSRSKTEQIVMKYTTYYEMAEIYYFQKRYKQFEETLNLILKDEYIEQNTKSLLYSQYISTLTGKRSFIERKGLMPLDELIYLYRLKDDFSQKAHRLLGEYYANNGNYEFGMKHNLIVILKVYTRIIQEIKKNNLDFEFSTSQEFFNYISKNNSYSLYMDSSELFKSMIDLGISVFGYEPSNIVMNYSREIWKLVVLYGNPQDKKTATLLLSLNNQDLRKYLLTMIKDFNFKVQV